MAKKILVCAMCGKEQFAEGDCPNELIASSGYIQDNKDWDTWYCSEKCKKEQR